jgi:tripeptidyl-peptidase-1
MGVFSNIFQFASVVHVVFASTLGARTNYAVKETHYIPPKWSVAGRAPSNHMLHLQIGLKQDGFGELERHLLEGTRPCLSLNLICY